MAFAEYFQLFAAVWTFHIAVVLYKAQNRNLHHSSHIDEIAASLNVPVLGKMPIDPAYAAKVDEGTFDEIDNPYIEAADGVLPQ